METKKVVQTSIDTKNNDALSKHLHQHNTNSQARLLQYSKPSTQYPLLNQPHQHPHVHQHPPQPIYHPSQTPQRLLQQKCNIQNNQLHQYLQPNTQHNQQQPRQVLNPLNQHNPQIWVPHQPPVHYHEQQLRTEQKQNVQAQPKSKEIERKKSSNQQLRSPTAKRPAQAPVTLQGWLHKQGSEGLMLWKKRWFVLSEYCLFYYKGPEEEKLLGSILLPSYKVSVCGPEDKINRKFAFKCEHANMRTYILAAESQESMLNWIRVLNLACLLQNTSSEPAPQRSVAQPETPSQVPLYRTTPIHMHSSSNATDLSSPSQQELIQYTQQPLYANAPPKPRRVNSSYSSPSPEVPERYVADIRRLNPYPPQEIYQKKPVYNPCVNHPEYVKTYNPTVRDIYNLPHNSERRTPDTYGRSKLTATHKGRYPGDYEDIYADQSMYKRPISPLAYTDVKKINPVLIPMQRVNTHVAMAGPSQMYHPVQLRRPPAVQIVRPHSADFLEYEVNRQNLDPNLAVRQQPRPKSSLDINRNAVNDNYFYSEQRYAENMRKSAQYLPRLPRVDHQHLRPSPYLETDKAFPLARSNTQPIAFENLSINESYKEPQPARSRSVLSEGSLSKELDVELRESPRVYYEHGSISPAQRQYNYDMRRREYDQFTRSASARLAQGDRISEGKIISREGEKKREESMKRLLEWKQRMLQSPLNRKVSQGTARSKPEYYVRGSDKFADKPPTSFSQYNSYSSDDEENEDRSKGNTQAQAGWTVDSPTATSTTAITSDNPKEQNPDAFTEPLKLFNKESSHLAHISSLRSEFSEKFEQSPVVTEIKSNGALVKSILAEFEKPVDEETPTNFNNALEENYVTMTPKKNVFELRSSLNSSVTPLHLDLDLDESPYMEMTQGMSSLDTESNSNTLPYEIVVFPGQKLLEPVYMELSHKRKLPDILQPSQEKQNKDNPSDSSDADDEASKDLDSLDTPSHPRFSLSDSFRPASYYLGASQVAQEFQDSSDSELVSPPPIPPNQQDNDESINSNYSLPDKKESELEQYQMKRRPVTDDSYENDLQKYLAIKNIPNKRFHDYENMYINHKRESSRETASPINSSGRHSVLSHDDYTQRCQQENMTCNSAELNSLLQISDCPTPIINVEATINTQEVSTSLYFQQKQTAPYYYSDLSMNTSPSDSTSTILTLNNQRGNQNGSKRDITHIVNPIRCTSRNALHRNTPENNFKLAVEARSASVDFLNLADKSGQIDNKNIYESDTLKRLKAMDSISSLQSNPETRNLYPSSKTEKFDGKIETNVRRSYSLEGLLENVLSESLENTQNKLIENSGGTEASYLWEEDSVFQERLRTASHRHTKSLDDLDSVCELRKIQKKQPRGITRLVTYVNDNVYNMPVQEQEDAKKDKNKNKEQSFIIDREKLRQWDLLSSAPSDAQGPRVNTAVVESQENEQGKGPEQASGSISLNARDTFPRPGPKSVWGPNTQSLQSRSTTNLSKNIENDYNGIRQTPVGHYGHQTSSQDLSSETTRKANWQWNNGMSVSAGELLGRTHEELVLLLIQLRRQSTNTCHAIEASYNEIDSIQAQLSMMDQAKRLENLQKLEQIKQHLIELEKQYEKGKPLVNLVDNMVKLGSLYRSPNERFNPYLRERLEFNQSIQERRLLTEEKRDWNRLVPNHSLLQEKVQELYQLDRLIQEESGTLHNLQQDKEDIERALGDLRQRINKGLNDPAEIEQARKQQSILENELTRVHSMLAENSKKLEETVAGNARLEQKLLVLKQKLQISRQHRNSPQFSNPGDSLPCFVGTSAMLESDLQKVQQKVGDLQRQRHELSMQVRQLTDRSNNLQHQIKSSNSNSQINQGNKRKVHSLWRETDLDTMNIVDHGNWENSTGQLYINTDLKQTSDSMKSSDSASDDTVQNPNSAPGEKQEIKTVRIVKRESERRQRDRERSVTGKWDPVLEEDDSSQSSSVLFCPAAAVQKAQNTMTVASTSAGLPRVYSDSRLTSSTDESSELSPIFKSEAARQIITEMSIQETPKLINRRLVPKEKRRHYTAPHNNLIMKSLNQLPTEDNAFDKMLMNTKRARDDLDMERALRQRIDAPDVVRSTLSNKELKYNENTIDTILGTPNKISIPERYIPEQLPQLSVEEQEHRLRKVESIKKMLSDTIITSSNPLSSEDKSAEKTPNPLANKATSKMIEEKKQREHLLQLNQILAKQVMEMSKIVAVKALAALPLQQQQQGSTEEEDLSPVTPLPLYQQRDNFYS